LHVEHGAIQARQEEELADKLYPILQSRQRVESRQLLQLGIPTQHAWQVVPDK
jgi:hypothetical protein